VSALDMDLDLSTADPFAAEWREDPWPLLHRLQDESPVHRFPNGGYLATRFDTCAEVLRDRRFGSDPSSLNERGRAAIGPNEVYQAGTSVLLFIDPPDHTRLRALVSKAFTPKVANDLRPWIASLVDDLLDTVIETGEMEVLTDIGYPLPAEVICQLLGVPDGDRSVFRTWSSAATRLLDGDLDAPTLEAGVAGALALFEYFTGLLETRRRRPGADLLSALVAAEDGGTRLSPDELITTVVTLFVAGHETTMNLIGNAVVALVDHPDQLRRLAVDPSLARAATEEALRYEGPAMLVPRVALEDLTVGGVRLDRGDSLVVCLAAANRDPRRFADPDRFDIERDDPGHLAFSFGPHHCLGSALARLEGEVTLAAMARRLHGLEFVGVHPRHRPHAILRGMQEVRVRFTPAAP
jgi:cytochrome P450